MNYTVGFDLGTHQTKICIQNATNQAEKTYEFLQFRKPDGSTSLLFPSVVQINKDHTLSYGYINEEDCLTIGGTSAPKPTLELLQEPRTVDLPKFIKPKSMTPKPKFDPWLDNLKRLKGEKTDVDKWEEECQKIEQNARKEWQSECHKIESEHEEALKTIRQKNEVLRKEFEASLLKWEMASVQQKLIFRYFKLHALTKTGSWDIHEFSSKEICVWYVAYILLILRERYGEDFVVQFGVPCGASNKRNDKIITRIAYEIFIAAADLIENFSGIDEYATTTYERLRSFTNLNKTINDSIINQYYFDDMPEAYASLVAVTRQGKLGLGFHILVDIGGGTTDLALFCVSNDKSPDVLYVTSFPHGINSILEKAQALNGKSLALLQSEFLKNRTLHYFRKPIKGYKGILVEEAYDIVRVIKHSFNSSYHYHGRKLKELEDALLDQPIIFGGGGGSFTELHTPVHTFNDILKIDRSMLDIHNLLTENISGKLFTILATSYGLASFEKPYGTGIVCTDIKDAFMKLPPQKNTGNNTSMADDSYEHGMSDT